MVNDHFDSACEHSVPLNLEQEILVKRCHNDNCTGLNCLQIIKCRKCTHMMLEVADHDDDTLPSSPQGSWSREESQLISGTSGSTSPSSAEPAGVAVAAAEGCSLFPGDGSYQTRSDLHNKV